MRWLSQALNLLTRRRRLSVVSTRKFGTLDPSDILSLDVPLDWPVVAFIPARSVDTGWLIMRLHKYQSTANFGDRPAFANHQSLAGDLFEAGFEGEDLAWLYGEKWASAEQVSSCLSSVGLGLLPYPWIMCCDIARICSECLEGSIGQEEANMCLYERQLANEPERYQQWVLDWEVLIAMREFEVARELVSKAYTEACELEARFSIKVRESLDRNMIESRLI